MSYDPKRALKTLEDVNDNYGKKYPNAIQELRKYTETLIFNSPKNKTDNIEDRLRILAFIEGKFNNDSKGFFNFIKSLNKFEKNTYESEKNIEKIIKEKLGYN